MAHDSGKQYTSLIQAIPNSWN